MDKKPKVIFKKVSKRFTLLQKKSDKLYEILLSKSNNKNFYALKNISFTVYEGETIGIIGINGSGKSTLSNLLAELVPPTSGDIKINGETSLIAISAGLNNNLTGLENIKLKCLMQGLNNDEIKNITPLIIEFAELGDFINQPVKNYSSGMKSRLGFAITVHTNPDIMIIDEALSVGDQTFYDKCINKMNEFKKEGKTIFFISHSISQVRSFCDKVMWIHYGELVEFGDTKEVINNYNKFIKYFNGLNDEEKKDYKKEKMAVQKIQDQKMPVDEPNLLTKRGTRKGKKGKHKGNLKVNLELALLFTLFIFSAFLMLFQNQGAEGMSLNKLVDRTKLEMKSHQEINKVEAKKEQKQEIKEINKIGYIINETEPIFKTDKLKNKLTTLNFSEQVHVDKKIGNVFEITSNNNKGFVNQEDIYIPQTPLEQSNFNISDYLQGFPESFVRSYQYYLVFLNSDQNSIESKLRGKTGEENDESGNKYLIFGNLKYRINSDYSSDQLIVSGFDQEKVDVHQLIEKANLVSKDKKNIYILAPNNEFIFNLNNNTVTISAGVKPIIQ